ncbi:glycosyltransferase family 4 protein [Bacteroidota bacterium]
MKVCWQTRSQVLYDSIVNEKLLEKANGGNAYDFQAAMALHSEFELNTDQPTVYRSSDNPLSYWWRMKNHLPSATHRIMEPYPIVFGGRFENSKNIAVLHHIDAHAETGGAKHKWFYNRLFERVKNFDKVVTVSKFWKKYLEDKGCNNVEVIYNAFNPAEYSFSVDELKEFRTKHGLEQDRPLVYIGNAAPGKGVYETYDALKHSNYQLIMTGGTNKAPGLPVKFLSLDVEDFRKLMGTCNIVVTMSNMMEGWNRVAHEAMLSRTPVIGSGSGGMKELLEEGKQMITQDFNQLPEMVEHCMEHSAGLSESGFRFVSRFDNTYFQNAWRSIIQ